MSECVGAKVIASRLRNGAHKYLPANSSSRFLIVIFGRFYGDIMLQLGPSCDGGGSFPAGSIGNESGCGEYGNGKAN